jgi:hypothetical protein
MIDLDAIERRCVDADLAASSDFPDLRPDVYDLLAEVRSLRALCRDAEGLFNGYVKSSEREKDVYARLHAASKAGAK